MSIVATLAVAGALAGCGGDDDSFGVRMANEAMLPTYAVGEELDVDRNAYDNGSPRVGDAVVFHAPVGAETGKCGATRRRDQPCPRGSRTSESIRLLLRVVAGPGQQIAFRRGHAIVDGEPEPQRRVRVAQPTCDICELPRVATVPAGHWYVVADNRSASSDSRVWGPVPTRAILGRVEQSD